MLNVNDLKVIDARELDEPDGFSATVSGSANISAQHWGHVDQRQVQFQLLLDLIEVKQQWQIADLTVIQKDTLSVWSFAVVLFAEASTA